MSQALSEVAVLTSRSPAQSLTPAHGGDSHGAALSCPGPCRDGSAARAGRPPPAQSVADPGGSLGLRKNSVEFRSTWLLRVRAMARWSRGGGAVRGGVWLLCGFTQCWAFCGFGHVDRADAPLPGVSWWQLQPEPLLHIVTHTAGGTCVALAPFSLAAPIPCQCVAGGISAPRAGGLYHGNPHCTALRRLPTTLQSARLPRSELLCSHWPRSGLHCPAVGTRDTETGEQALLGAVSTATAGAHRAGRWHPHLVSCPCLGFG